MNMKRFLQQSGRVLMVTTALSLGLVGSSGLTMQPHVAYAAPTRIQRAAQTTRRHVVQHCPPLRYNGTGVNAGEQSALD